MDSTALCGVLPYDLRVLLLCGHYNWPLQPGSLPSTLSSPQLGYELDQRLGPGVLPASLLYLSVTARIKHHHQLLLPSLPASLERLKLYSWPRPLQAGALPPQLKALHLGEF